MEIEERRYCVYMHTSPSGKVYIGITRTSPEKDGGRTGAVTKNRNIFGELFRNMAEIILSMKFYMRI